MKYAFLLGAGASHGAGRIQPRAPPLGSTLYRELSQEFPQTWGSIPNAAASLFQDDFETGMELVWQDHRELVGKLIIDMAVFFSKFEPPSDSSDRYSALIGEVLKNQLEEKAGFATLNYECVLESAINSFGSYVAYAGRPPIPGNIVVWKLHGSCNFLPDIGTNRFIDVTFTGGEQFYDGPIKAVDRRQIYERYVVRKDSIPPVMSVYVRGKPTPVSPKFLAERRTEWASWVAASDKVVTIGARPVLSESYVWQPVIDSSAEVFYVGGKAGDYETLQGLLGGRLKFIAPRLADAMDTIRSVIIAE